MAWADLVLKNGKVATINRNFDFVEAVAVKDGRIIDLGGAGEMERHIGPQTQVIDLEGRTMLPAASDSHMHAVLAGYTMSPYSVQVGAPAVQSLEDLRSVLAQAAKEAGPGQWICGTGWMSAGIRECAAEHRELNRWDIDPATPDNPVMLSDFGLHTLLVNSKALELAGIGAHTPDLPVHVGAIQRDPATGEPTGLLSEWGAQVLVAKHGPKLTDQQIEDCIRRVQHALNKEGITSHCDILGVGGDDLVLGTMGERCIHVYEKMAREGRLTARANIQVLAGLDGVQSYDTIIGGLERASLPEFHDRNWVKADAVKIFGDGTWQREFQPGDPRHGRSAFPGGTDEEQAAEMKRTFLEVHRRGWQISVHSMGSRTIDVCVEGFAEAQERYPREAPRHIILHGDQFTDGEIRTAAKHQIVNSTQPVSGYLVMDFFGNPEAIQLQRLADGGVILAGGSDAPCFPYNWRLAVQFATTRTTMMGNTYRPDLAWSLEDAIWAYTMGGAMQEHMEHARGSIEVGKVADFQVLGRDIFTIPKEEIGQIPVVMTFCGGKLVYQE